MLIRYLFVLVSTVLLINCAAIQPFPGVVRAGDTITLAIGSLEGVTENNITILYYPDLDPDNPVDITNGIRSVFNIYPDKTSEAYWDVTSGFGLDTLNYVSKISSHAPWQTVVALNLPTNISAGLGTINVTLGAGVIYPSFLKKVDDVDISIEILAAIDGIALQGAAHDFEFKRLDFNEETSIGDLSKLKPLRRVVVRSLPDPNTSSPSVSAVEYLISLSVLDQSQNDVTNQLTQSDFAVILDDHPEYIIDQTSLIWSKQGNQFKVIIVAADEIRKPEFLRYSIILSNLVMASDNGWSLGDTATLDSIKYFNSNGDLVMQGPFPEVVVLD